MTEELLSYSDFSNEVSTPIQDLSETKSLLDYLQLIQKNSCDWLLWFVASDIIDSSDDSEGFVEDVLQFWCVSGMVSSLMYNQQIHEFYDNYYYEIEELRICYEENLWMALPIKGDLKNFLARFAYEETTRKIYESWLSMKHD